MAQKKAEQKQQEESKSKVIKTEGDFEMPEMEKDPNQSQYEEVYFIKPKTKDAAYFEVTKKAGNEYITNPRKDVNSLGGDLVKIELGSYVYKDEEKKTVKLHIVKTVGEKKYLYIMSSSYTQAFRSVINCILDVNVPIEKIHITLVPKDGFTNAVVSINGVASKWKTNSSGPGKYSREDLKEYIIPITHPKTGAVLQTDYSKLDEFLQDELQNHLSVVLPGETHRRIIPEEDASKHFEKEEIKDQTAIFGEDASDFFEIEENN